MPSAVQIYRNVREFLDDFPSINERRALILIFFYLTYDFLTLLWRPDLGNGEVEKDEVVQVFKPKLEKKAHFLVNKLVPENILYVY